LLDSAPPWSADERRCRFLIAVHCKAAAAPARCGRQRKRTPMQRRCDACFGGEVPGFTSVAWLNPAGGLAWHAACSLWP